MHRQRPRICLQIARPGRPRPGDEPEVLAVPFVPGRDDVGRAVRRQAADPGVPRPGQERGQLRCGHALPRHRSLSRPFTLPQRTWAHLERDAKMSCAGSSSPGVRSASAEHSPPGVSYTTPLTILPTSPRRAGRVVAAHDHITPRETSRSPCPIVPRSDVRPVAATLYFLPIKTRMPLKFGPET